VLVTPAEVLACHALPRHCSLCSCCIVHLFLGCFLEWCLGWRRWLAGQPARQSNARLTAWAASLLSFSRCVALLWCLRFARRACATLTSFQRPRFARLRRRFALVWRRFAPSTGLVSRVCGVALRSCGVALRPAPLSSCAQRAFLVLLLHSLPPCSAPSLLRAAGALGHLSCRRHCPGLRRRRASTCRAGRGWQQRG